MMRHSQYVPVIIALSIVLIFLRIGLDKLNQIELITLSIAKLQTGIAELQEASVKRLIINNQTPNTICLGAATDYAVDVRVSSITAEMFKPTQVIGSITVGTDFDDGVRYGLLAYMENPKEDSIPKITQRAAEIWLSTSEVSP